MNKAQRNPKTELPMSATCSWDERMETSEDMLFPDDNEDGIEKSVILFHLPEIASLSRRPRPTGTTANRIRHRAGLEASWNLENWTFFDHWKLSICD
jgi:hypothetical protein